MNLTPEEKIRLISTLDYLARMTLHPLSNIEIGSTQMIRALIESCPEPRTEEERREFVEKWANHFHGAPIDDNCYGIHGFRKNIRDMLTEWDNLKETINEEKRIPDNPANNPAKKAG